MPYACAAFFIKPNKLSIVPSYKAFFSLIWTVHLVMTGMKRVMLATAMVMTGMSSIMLAMSCVMTATAFKSDKTILKLKISGN